MNQSLSKAISYREFMAVYYQHMKSKNPRFSYASWARQCGFATKSYLRDIACGTKRLAPASVMPVRDSLRAPQEMKDLFFWLVAEEEADCPIDASTRTRLAKKVRNLRSSSVGSSKKFTVKDALFANADWPLVFAALGTEENGARLLDVCSRTDLSESRAISALAVLTENGMAKQKGQRFFPLSAEAILSETEKVYFKNFYLRSLENLALKARKSFGEKQNLFFHMAFSIDPKRQPEFRERLNDLLQEYIDQCEAPEGRKVVSLICGLI